MAANPQPERKFARYFSHPNVTVSIVAGDSFSPLLPAGPREVLIVRDTWYPDDPEREVAGYVRASERISDRVFFLSNTKEIHAIRLRHGLNSHYVNIGCFINEGRYCPVDRVGKDYDAVMTARFWTTADGAELKRHHLTGKIRRLALLDPIFWSTDEEQRQKYSQRENCRFINDRRLPPHKVVDILRRARVGLALSPLEGVCRASSEYLLTGLPVVSTESVGGRDVWYDDYNSIIVPPNEDDVAAAVERLVAEPRDPWKIRRDYLSRAEVFRNRFRDDVLDVICTRFGVDWDLDEIMQLYPFQWWPAPARLSPAWWASGLWKHAPSYFLRQHLVAPLQRRWNARRGSRPARR